MRLPVVGRSVSRRGGCGAIREESKRGAEDLSRAGRDECSRGAALGVRVSVASVRWVTWVTWGTSLALLVLSVGVGWAADSPTSLEVRLDATLQVDSLVSAKVGALVIGEGGETLYARDPDVSRIPASNMKLLTALAALDAFGPSHRFETVIVADRDLVPTGAVGELGIRGGGDPALNSEDWWRLAADLRRNGLVRVEGDVVVDPSCFDAAYWHPAWGEPSSRAFHAPVAGLSANYGAFFVRVGPGLGSDDPVRVQVDPPLSYFQVQNRGRTLDAGDKGSLSIGRGEATPQAETVVVSGDLGLGEPARNFARSVRDPVLYAGALFKMQLEAVGIEVEGRVRRGIAKQPVELLRHRGRPLAEIVRLFLKYSNNAMAEGLVKAMGAQATGKPGSWPAGLAEVRGRLDALEVLGPGAELVDGSGLSPDNRVSPRVLVEALNRGASSFRFGPEYVAALPIAGRDGTLEHRTAASVDGVRAKTGLLKTQRVVALSGYAERADGESVIFSILINGYSGAPDDAMRAVDAWVEALIQVEPSE